MSLDLPEFDGGGDGGGPGGGSIPPTTGSGDWANIANFAAGFTGYKDVNFSGLNTSEVLDLGGTYTVQSVASNYIVLSNPSIPNPHWDHLTGSTAYASPALSTTGERWIGPFVLDLDDLDRVIANFEGLNGLYLVTNKGKQQQFNVSIMLEMTPINALDTPIGGAEVGFVTVEGSANTKQTRAATLRAYPSFRGRCQVRARRLTPTNLDYDGTIVDEVKWVGCYGLAAVDITDFGDITIAHARTVATSGATSLKQRRLNARVTRKIRTRISGTEFTEGLTATERADEIISAVTLDPYIGRRKEYEIDFDSVYDSIAEVEAYFGTDQAVKFGFTFDDSKTSYEEIVTAIAAAAYCTAYRVGNVIRLKPDLATNQPVMLFNHRNILPGTQKRGVTFGVNDDNDGVDVNYAAVKDGAPLTYYAPPDRESVSPRNDDLTGVRYYAQAFWHAWRAWNKLQFQNVTMEFDGTQEARLVTRNDRIMVSNQTQPGMGEGEVVASRIDAGDTILRLSQPVALDGDNGWTIYLQHTNESVEPMGVEQGDDPFEVVLERAPSLALVTDQNAVARTGWIIVENTDFRSRAYLVSSREPNGPFAESLQAINYSPLYYLHDTLAYWLLFGLTGITDQGPWQYGTEPSGVDTLVLDADRGRRLYEGASGSYIDPQTFRMPVSYSIAVWVKGGAVSILTSGTEGLVIAGGTVTLHHGGTTLAAPWAVDDTWTYLGATYDADAGEAVLYVNAVEVARGPLDPRTPAALHLLADLTGRADDLRVWRSVLVIADYVALYRASGALVTTPYAYGTEDGQALGTEDGQRLILE